VIPVPGESFADEVGVLEAHWADFDFFFVHFKATDAAGEDGDFERKVRLFEEVDREIPRILALEPETLVVTSDHSTPARLKAHSWHPSPFVLWSPHARPDRVESFGERELARGGLGRFPAREAMPLMMAHALKLEKFGA
jgi:2,3-bisphosphoglycerate-independent phosphoglycerate mutase